MLADHAGDQWAVALAGDEGFAWLAKLPTNAALWPTVRTWFLADCLDRWRDEPASEQAVLVAMGLDTRAYRLPWSAMTSLFELDQPALLAEKDRILAQSGASAACRRIALGIDLRGA